MGTEKFVKLLQALVALQVLSLLLDVGRLTN
jgi:hypothetical protein